MTDMQYRRLGRSGLKVSLLSFGSWVTFANADQIETAKQAAECLNAAKEAGVNFFDNAEAYSARRIRARHGRSLSRTGLEAPRVRRLDEALLGTASTSPTCAFTLNRKYLTQAIDGSLERFGLDFVDLVFCHRPDPKTPIEETVWAMSDMITQGKALYWGTSEWHADEIRAAYDIADRHHLHKPRHGAARVQHPSSRKVEKEFAAALRGHRTRHDHLVATGLGSFDRQVPQRRAGRVARVTARLRMAEGDADR